MPGRLRSRSAEHILRSGLLGLFLSTAIALAQAKPASPARGSSAPPGAGNRVTFSQQSVTIPESLATKNGRNSFCSEEAWD
jgi:hypothetical protein